MASWAVADSTLRVGTASDNGRMIVFVAVDKGFFAKHGLDAKVVVRNTGAQRTKCVKAGEIDFAPRCKADPKRFIGIRLMTQGFVDAMSGAAAYVRYPNNLDEIAQIGVRYVRGMDADIVKRTFQYWT